MLARRSTRSAGAIPWRVPGENQRTVGGESAAAAAAISQQPAASSQQPSAVGCRLGCGLGCVWAVGGHLFLSDLASLSRLSPAASSYAKSPSGLQPNSQALDEAPSTSRLALLSGFVYCHGSNAAAAWLAGNRLVNLSIRLPLQQRQVLAARSHPIKSLPTWISTLG